MRETQSRLNRREFITLAGMMAGTGAARFSNASVLPEATFLPCPERLVPIVRHVDVLVAGGGPAGCAAALYAARSGARVLLIENMPFMGGVWTSVGVSHLIAGRECDGVNAEIRERLPVYRTFDRDIYVIEDMKGLLDRMMLEARVEVQLHTRAVAVSRNGDRLRGVFTESKSGLEFIEAKMVVDATGDGDVAAGAGCAFEMGRPGDGKTQPITLFGTIGGYRGEPAKGKALVDILAKAGRKPSYPGVTLFPQPGQQGVFVLMATQFYGVSGIDVRDLTKAEMQGRREIRACVEAFKKHGGNDWKDIFLIKTGPCIGVRATRRVRGLYYLTWEDLERGARFEDGITEIRSGSNIHDVDDPYVPLATDLPEPPRFQVRPYQIPLRALIARDANNLVMAGRCISGDHYALGSYRLTGNVVRTGEAAGLAASLAARQDILPKDLDIMDLLEELSSLRASGQG